MRVQPQRRKWIIWAALVLAVAMVVAPALLSGPDRQQGTARAVAAGELEEKALASLGELTDLQLSGTVYTESGVPLRTEIVALTDGDTSATVTDPSGGTAEFLVTKDTAAIKANRTWWLNTVPAYAKSLPGKWTKADGTMGFPVDMLRGLVGGQLAATITSGTADADWTAAPVTFDGDVPATALSTTDGKWTLYVPADGEPRVLGVGGPLATGPDHLRGQTGASSYPYTTLTTTPADDPCKENAGKTVEQAKPQAAAAPAPPELTTEEHGPSVSIQIVPTGVCSNTPTCAAPVTVQNSGDRPATGSVTLSSTSGGGGTLPVSVPAGGSTPLDFTVGNPAASCTQTCERPYNVTAMYLDASAGSNVGAAKRLKDKGIDPNLPDPGNPALAGPDVVDLLSGLVQRVPGTPGFSKQSDAGQRAVDLAETFLKNREIALVKDLILAPQLKRGGGKDPVLALVEAAESASPADAKAALVRTLYLLHDLVKQAGQQKNSLVLNNSLVEDTQHQKVYAVTALAGRAPYDKRETNRSVAAADMTVAFDDHVASSANKLAAYTTHPGYTRELVFYVDGTTPGVSSWSRTQFIRYLVKGERSTPPRPQARTLLADQAGKPKIDGFVLVNKASEQAKISNRFGGAYELGKDDIRMLTADLGPNPPPTAAPTAKDLHWDDVNREHRLHGDPADPSDVRQTGPEPSGGHLGGTGFPGKTEFPTGWSETDIIAAEKQLMVPANLQAGGPTKVPNALGVPEYGYQWSGPVTVNGITVDMTMFAYPDGGGRTSYPVADRNPANGKPPTDPGVVFTNPPLPSFPGANGQPTRVPQGLTRLTQVPRYDRAANRWTYVGVDRGSTPLQVTTDDKGTVIGQPMAPAPKPGSKPTTKPSPPAPGGC